jgi:hypothetical protein
MDARNWTNSGVIHWFEFFFCRAAASFNTLNKTIADDFDGISYWVDMLEAGTSRGEAVATLVGAINDYAPDGPYYNPDDTATVAAYNQFTNRVTVSDYMADNVYATPDDWATSTSFSYDMVVTDDPGTVWAAKANVDLLRWTKKQNSKPSNMLKDYQLHKFSRLSKIMDTSILDSATRSLKQPGQRSMFSLAMNRITKQH